MKRLLVYNQSDTELTDENIDQDKLQVEQVATISEVFGRLLLSRRTEFKSAPFDIFVVYVDEPGTEIVDFLTYIQKYKPGLPLIVLSATKEKTTLLRNLLKGTVSHVSESVHFPEVLKSVAY
jgi:CheY-like chemotaxis protein